MCQTLTTEMDKTERLVRAVGSNPTTSALWAAIVTASDAWTEYGTFNQVLVDVAKEAGITRDAWEAIRDGSA